MDAQTAVESAVQQTIHDGPEVGVQVTAYLHGELVVDVSCGVADLEDGREVDGETIFTVFSATKGVAATALHIQAERGLIAYEALIVDYWPGFAARGKSEATVLDALTHRCGVPQMPAGGTPQAMCDWDGMVAAIELLPPLWVPGTKTGYHAYTYGWIVGELVRRTDPQHRPFGRFVQEEICAPLGMDSFWMGIPDAVESRCARLINTPAPPADARPVPPDALVLRAIPPEIGVVQEVFGPARRSPRLHPGGRRHHERSLARSPLRFARGARRSRRRAAAIGAAGAADLLAADGRRR